MDELESRLQKSNENMTKESLERIMEELFPSSKIAQFSIDWILSRPEATEDPVREVYAFLKSKGLEDDKIATHAALLGRDPDAIERNYKRLSALGLSKSKIATNAQLLGRDPDTIEGNYKRLSALGLSDSNIAINAQLLGRDPDAIERNYKRLSALGLSDSNIATNAQLLGRDPDAIERNYQTYIGLLRQDYKNRASGRDLLTNQAQLLGNSPETVEGNVQFLYNLRVDYNDGLLLGTTPSLKRKKMAWMLRELFDYRTIPQEKRREAISGLYSFIRANPRVLVESISSMENGKYKLREKAAPYRSDILPVVEYSA